VTLTPKEETPNRGHETIAGYSNLAKTHDANEWIRLVVRAHGYCCPRRLVRNAPTVGKHPQQPDRPDIWSLVEDHAASQTNCVLNTAHFAS
jgi:hypothetical protein